MKCNDSCSSCQYVLSNCFLWHENLLLFTDTVSMANQTKPEIPSLGTQQVSTAFCRYNKVFLDVVKCVQT